MVACSKCGEALGDKDGRPLACISGSVMGDEYTDAYYFCDACDVYTVVGYRDRFGGEETSGTRTPVSKEEGDKKLALIRECSDPSEKRCRCASHRAYFGSWLD